MNCCYGAHIHPQVRGKRETRSILSVLWVHMYGLEVTSFRYGALHECVPGISYSRWLQAHVDGTATIINKQPDGESVRITFKFPEPTVERPSLLPYIIPKGYIAMDGTSLTITQVDDVKRTFGIMLITHTQEKITLPKKPIGAKVNIEVDMVGKYVQKSVVAALGGGGSEGIKALVEKVVEDVLAKKGLGSN